MMRNDYFVLEGLYGPKIINSRKEFEEVFNSPIKDEFFLDKCLLCIPYTGSSSIRSGKLYDIEIVEDEKINVYFTKNLVPEFMDLRRLSILIPYPKSGKELFYLFR